MGHEDRRVVLLGARVRTCCLFKAAILPASIGFTYYTHYHLPLDTAARAASGILCLFAHLPCAQSATASSVTCTGALDSLLLGHARGRV
jgi:hypothetical protein